MTDTKVKGSGNSRKLITVPNAPTLYPDHDTLMQKWATEGIPVDISNLLAIGCEIIGTALSKANLLSDATATAIGGLSADPTVNEALARLRTLISTAQSTANRKLIYEAGSYSGNGNYAAKSLSFNGDPKILIVFPFNATLKVVFFYHYPYIYPIGGGAYFTTGQSDQVVSWGSNQATLSRENSGQINQVNVEGNQYRYFAITQK